MCKVTYYFRHEAYPEVKISCKREKLALPAITSATLGAQLARRPTLSTTAAMTSGGRGEPCASVGCTSAGSCLPIRGHVPYDTRARNLRYEPS